MCRAHDAVGQGVRLVRLQHFGEIGMQPVIPHARQHLAQYSHHPALPAIEKGDALADVRDCHCLAVEGADFHGRSFTKGFEMTDEHRAPARFVPLNGPHQLGDRAGAGCARAPERDPCSGTLRLW